MAKILHHTDDDGFCAAAIARIQIVPTGIVMSEADFTAFNYKGKINIPEFHENEMVIIVDISLHDEVFKYIKAAVKAKANVIHIDHHESSLTYLRTASPTKRKVLDKIKRFYNMQYSGCLLAYIYATAPEELKDGNIGFYVSANKREFYLDRDASEHHPMARMIPTCVQYINDRDLWKFELPDTKAFSAGFSLHENKHPLSSIWENYLYDYSGIITDNDIEEGTVVCKERQIRYNRIAKTNAFETDMFGYKCICLNSPERTSEALGDLFNEYPLGLVFNMDKDGYWRYSIYNNTSIKPINVAKIARFFEKNGGGHRGASGFTLRRNIFAIKSGKLTQFRTLPYEVLN